MFRVSLFLAAVCAAQAQDVRLTLSAEKTEFRLGEVIALQLQFTSAEPGKHRVETRLHDRIGRLNYVEEFVAEPAAWVEDPLNGLPHARAGLGGITGGPLPLSEKPFTIVRVLNEWLRFRREGEYRVHVISRRVQGLGPIRSNVLVLKIQPAPPDWVARQIVAARKAIETASDPAGAIDVLRSLHSLEAGQELVRWVDVGDASMGVLGSPYRRQLLPYMEKQLASPDQPVSERYLETLVELSCLVEGTRDPGAMQRKRMIWIDRLSTAVLQKRGRARAVSLHTLLGYRNVGAAVLDDFRDLPVITQLDLLEHRWETLRSAAAIPLLRELIAADPRLRDIAVRRLYELAPMEARSIILDEIRSPKLKLSFATLAILPEPVLSELDDVLVERFDFLLIARYASSAVAPRVRQRFLEMQADLRRQNVPSCAGPLMFYFLKSDPAFGEAVMRAEVGRPSGPPACYDIGSQFGQLGRWAYSPALERLSIEFLQSPLVPVKRGAAELLGKYGSAAA